jgi:hypothetical protein
MLMVVLKIKEISIIIILFVKYHKFNTIMKLIEISR